MNILYLKIIALLTMIIDHYGAIFHSGVSLYRIIGRIAFPIYCFLLVEGFFHTKDLKKYGLRLFIFALISELPFDLAFYNTLEFRHQNIFFTLFIGLVTMYFLENKEKYKLNKHLIILTAGFVSILLYVDYNFVGLVYILLFYYMRNLSPLEKLIKIGLLMLVVNFVFSGYIQQFSILALSLIYFYNGKLGPKNKPLQILFYAAYPLHLLLFYLIRL